MAVRELVEYLITVDTDTAKAKRGFAGLVREAKAAAQGIGAVAAGFTAIGVAAVTMANDLTGSVDRINTTAAATGLLATEVQALELAANAAGKDVEKVIPKDLAKRILEASQGVGESKAAWDQLGVSAVDAEGNLRSSSEVLRDLIDKLGGVSDATERAALAEKALGGEARELVQVLSDRGDLDAWMTWAERYAMDVGPEAQRVTAKWQRSMTIFSQGVEATKAQLMPFVDLLSNVVVGLTAMAVAGTAYAKAFFTLKNPIKAAYEATSDWVGSVRDLNTELGRTPGKIDAIAQGYSDMVADLGFDPGTGGLFGVVSNVTAGRSLDGRKPPKDEDPKGKGGTGKREPGVLDMTPGELRRLEEEQAAYGRELREARIAQQGATKAVVTITEAYEALGVQVGDEHYRRASRDALGDAAATADSAMSPVGLISGAVQDLVGIMGEATGLVQGVTDSIQSLPEQLIAFPTAVSGLVEALGGLVPALIEASPDIAMAIASAMVDVALVQVEVVGQALAALFEQLPNDIAQAIAEALRNLGGELNPFDGDGRFLGGIAERIPFFEEGGRVNRTGLAVVHAGETVVPAAADRGAAFFGGGMGAGATIHVHTTDGRVAAREISEALGPYGLGVGIGGVR